MSGVGKDSDYVGGDFLRMIDRGLQSMGVSRDSEFMRTCHSIEHQRRAEIAKREGDFQREEAERQRANENLHKNTNKSNNQDNWNDRNRDNNNDQNNYHRNTHRK